jgi:hypothetical protein
MQNYTIYRHGRTDSSGQAFKICLLSLFMIFLQSIKERKELVFHPVFKTGSRWIKPSVAGSIPALSAKMMMGQEYERYHISEETLIGYTGHNKAGRKQG